MAKKQEKAALGATEDAQKNANQNYDSLRGENTQVGTNRDDEIYAGYKGFSETGGVDPNAKSRLLGGYGGTSPAGGGGSSSGGGGGGGGGSIQDYYSDIKGLDRSTYDAAENAFKNLDTSYAKNFADTGGLDEAAMARMRGMGGYEEFAKTGGYSDVDKANIRERGLSAASAMGKGMQDEMSARRATQGGYSPGFDASSRALKRDTARNITDNALNTELGIKEKTNEGRKWGISGVAGSEQATQQLKTQNQLEGSKLKAQIEQAVASGQMSAADGRARIDQVQQQTDLAIATGRTQRDIAAMQLAAANGNASASRALAEAQMAAQNERFVMELEQSGKLAGLGGMSNLYQTNMDRDLNITNSQVGANVNLGQLRSQQADMIGGPWDAVQQGIGGVAGLAGAFSGLGGFTGGNTGISGPRIGAPPSYNDFMAGKTNQGWF